MTGFWWSNKRKFRIASELMYSFSSQITHWQFYWFVNHLVSHCTLQQQMLQAILSNNQWLYKLKLLSLRMSILHCVYFLELPIKVVAQILHRKKSTKQKRKLLAEGKDLHIEILMSNVSAMQDIFYATSVPL